VDSVSPYPKEIKKKSLMSEDEVSTILEESSALNVLSYLDSVYIKLT
jgi:hypothetical protein